MLFANNCNTTLNGGITAIATSMVVTSATGFPSPTGSQYFYCTLADAATQTTIEIVKVTAVSGTTFTIVRGQDGTTGTIFASGAVVSLRLVAASLNDFPKLDEVNTFTGLITASGGVAGALNGTVGATTATTGAFTTVTASTSVTTPIVQASNSGGLALKNSGGTTQMSVGAGGGDNMSINVSTNLNGTNAQIDISPTGTGHVHMNPSGSGSVQINPTNVGTMDNITIGATTAKNASFVDLSVTGTTSFDGAQGTAGQVLTSAGAGTPTWTTPTTGTVTSVAALTLGTTGTDLSSTVATGTTTPVITLQVPTASATNRGALSAADWTTFNGKVSSQWITSSSNIYYSTGNVGIGTSSPATTLEVNGVGKFATGISGGLGLVALGDNGTTAYNVGIFRGAANNISSAGNFLNIGGFSGIVFTSSSAALGSQAEVMRMFPSGGVSIGNSTDAGAANLSVTGSTTARAASDVIYANAGGASTFRITNSDTAAPSFGAVQVKSGSSANVWQFFARSGNGFVGQAGVVDSMTFFPSGGVSIGNTTDAGAGNLSVNGTGKFGTTVGVGAATPSASGAGITFPATQSASTDVNTLDDYEEGTWTPTQGGGLTVVGTFSSSGTYTKIGRQVTVSFRLFGSTSIAAANTGQLTTNLPFTASSGNLYQGGACFGGTFSTSAYVSPSATTAQSVENIAATASIQGTITYDAT